MRILFLVDSKGSWCWTTQMKGLHYQLEEHEMQFANPTGWKKHRVQLEDWADLIYMRGYPFLYLDDYKPLSKPFVWTLTTGGNNLDMRIEQSLRYSVRSQACVVQNKEAFEKATKAGIKNITLLPNGIDTAHFCEFEIMDGEEVAKVYDVGFAGNNIGDRERLKGTDIVKRVIESSNGDISYREVTNLAPIDYVDMPKFYNSIRIYAQPSDSEGSSNSVMEAMSCSKVCLICKDVGYHGEVCNGDMDDPKAEVVFVERNEESIRNAIMRLKTDLDTYDRIARNARAFAERHAWSVVADQYRTVINSAVKRFVRGCENCVYYCEKTTYHGYCKRYPPMRDRLCTVAQYPTVISDDKCGEWRSV